jgi:thiol-disulfide isomerase/thioredoxin
LLGKQLPSFEVTGKDGATFASDSLRGAPLLIDNWATWCAPCVASLPDMAAFYAQTKCKGLVLVGLDHDEIEGKANDFLAKRHYYWPDYHESEEVREMWGKSGIPRVILVDPNGKVVYDEPEFTPDELSTELAKMGQQYEGLASDSSVCPTLDEKPDRTHSDSAPIAQIKR